MPGLSLTNVSKHFGPVEVIRNLSLEIAEGEFAVFLGPSGCGKTTLLRMIAGLEAVSAGEIQVDDRRIEGLPPGKRAVAMVFQHYALYPHMSVRQNMSFGLRNVGTSREEIGRRIASAAQVLEIDHLLDRKPGQLSGGQRQRVAIGRAIVKQPRLFLFDEPLSNLDAALRSRTRVELARLHHRMQSTMVFVTHDQVEAMTMATRIVVINQGRVEQVGSPIEIYNKPQTRFVASFIGNPAMNFLPVAGLEQCGQVLAVRLQNGAIVPTAVAAEAVPRSAVVALGVRAEHVQPGQGIPATVDVLERLGDRTLVYAALEDGSTLVYQEPATTEIRVGDRVDLSINGAAAHLFDDQGLAYNAH